MITKTDVALADSIPKLLEEIKAEQTKLSWEQVEEEKRREVFNKTFWTKQGTLRRMQQEVDKAGVALQRMRAEVPTDVSRENNQAQADLRAHAESLKRALGELRSYKEDFERKRKDGEDRGMPLEKLEVEMLQKGLQEREAIHQAEVCKRADLEARVVKTQRAYDAAFANVRRGAK